MSFSTYYYHYYCVYDSTGSTSTTGNGLHMVASLLHVGVLVAWGQGYYVFWSLVHSNNNNNIIYIMTLCAFES